MARAENGRRIRRLSRVFSVGIFVKLNFTIRKVAFFSCIWLFKFRFMDFFYNVMEQKFIMSGKLFSFYEGSKPRISVREIFQEINCLVIIPVIILMAINRCSMVVPGEYAMNASCCSVGSFYSEQPYNTRRGGSLNYAPGTKS